jgi:hypothetical protein
MNVLRCLSPLLFALLAGCAQPELQIPIAKLVVPRTEQGCTSAGGHWGPMGFFRNVGCDIKTTDAGKSCSDSSQCRASCLGPKGALAGSAVAGSCSAYLANFGNVVTVENGKAVLLNVE